jgi:hypothetical protein
MTPDAHSLEARLLAKQQIDNELTKARTELAKLRCERDAITVAMRKGELIRRYDAKLQLGLGISALRQRLMSLSYALPRQLAGRNEHEIGRIIDAEVRSALRDAASWPTKLGRPGWDKEIDGDLKPASEDGGNGESDDGADASAKRERANAARRAKYAQGKEKMVP